MEAALPAIAAGAAIAGTALSAYGLYQAGKAQEQAYEYNAAVAARRGAQEEYEHRLKLEKLMARQRALYAKAGVDMSSGSPLLVLSETAAEGEREALAIRTGAKEESSLERFYGEQARRAGAIGAGGTFLTGLGQTGTSYYYGRAHTGLTKKVTKGG